MRNDPSLIEETNPGYPYVGPEEEGERTEPDIPFAEMENNDAKHCMEKPEAGLDKQIKEYNVMDEYNRSESQEGQDIVVNDKSTPEPSSSETEKESSACNINRKRGYCSSHDVTARRILVTTKKWKDRGGGKGFGYVSSRVVKYICQAKSNPVSDDHTNRQLMGGSVRADNVADGDSHTIPEHVGWSESTTLESESFNEME